MRLALIALILTLPGAALAAEDRYGPARKAPPTAVAGGPVAAGTAGPSAYGGPTLTWSGKQGGAPEPRLAPARADPPLAQPAPARTYSAAPVPAVAPPSQPLPQSLYDSPAPTPRPPEARPQVAPQGYGSQGSGPQPAPVAAFQPPPAPTPPSEPPVYRGVYGANAPRAYSVVREFGGQPDRIPSARENGAGRTEITLAPDLVIGGQSGGEEPQPPDDDAEIRKRRALEQPQSQGRSE